MKKALFLFLLGALAGAYGYYYLREVRPNAAARPAAKPAEPAAQPTLLDKAKAGVHDASEAVAQKLEAWHLTPERIREDFSKTGQVVRTKTHTVGETISGAVSNARIETTIAAKYALDKEISARAIEVECDAGRVTLTGKTSSPELVAKAIRLAIETDGVTEVKSLIAVELPAPTRVTQ